jgi:CheY-like chemotaxis protein
VEFDLGELPSVPCNAADLRELLVNLVFNAVDAMPQGGILTLQTKCCDRFATIGVSDTGIGMSDEVKQRCMEPFFSTKGENGTGLGLSMVFGIIRRHEGDVRIDSAPGEGTTFWISIPLVAEKVVVEDDETVHLDARLKILVVDDDPMPRDILVRYLEQDGHEVVGLGSGREALGRHTREKFNVVITDQAMPHITGVQLARAMRRVVPEQRVILVTGFEQENVPSDATADVDMVLKKPVSQNGLRKALAQIANADLEEERLADRVVPVVFGR